MSKIFLYISGHGHTCERTENAVHNGFVKFKRKNKAIYAICMNLIIGLVIYVLLH